MEISNTLLYKLENLVSELDNSNCTLDRHIAIREAARLLVCLTHQEFLNDTNPFDKKYYNIACTCKAFVESA